MTLVAVKKNKLIKGGEESKILDMIECGEKYMWPTLISLLMIHNCWKFLN